MFACGDSRRPLPISFPVPANRMRHGEAKGLVADRAVVHPAVILKPSSMGGVLVQIARADIMMLTGYHAAQA